MAIGLYDADGKIRTTSVVGTTLTGLWAADGSVNCVFDDSTHIGIYHPCGALRVNSTGGTATYDASGAYNLNHMMGSFLGGASKPSFNFIADGDSITLGLGGKPAWPFAALAAMPGGSPSTSGTNTPTSSVITGVGPVALNDIATSGISLTTIAANYSTRAGAQFVSGKTNLLAIMGGTNGTETIKQLYVLLRSIVRNARATGYQRVVVGTTTARNDDGGTKWAATLQPFNALIRAYYNNDLDADGLMDFGNDSRFNTPTAASDPTYYDTVTPPVDLHPNQLGEFTMGAIAEPVLLAALQGAGARILAPATWSPVDYDDSHLTLSNSNRTVAWTSTGFTNPSARGFIGKSSGKWFWEVVADTASFVEIGLGNQTFDFNATTFNLQNNTNTIAWGYSSNNLTYNNTTAATMGALANGDIVQVAVDVDAKLMWIRKSTGNWNGSASNNPATGVGGVDISAIVNASAPNKMIYPAGYIRQNGGQYTSNFALAQMTGPVPSGFKALDQ